MSDTNLAGVLNLTVDMHLFFTPLVGMLHPWNTLTRQAGALALN